MGRLEYKYLVGNEHLDRLRRALLPFVELDSFTAAEPEHQYTVRSIYYDTPGLACYVQKEAGIHTRRKLRVRGYGAGDNGSLVVLEIKRKYDMEVSKSRAFIRYDLLEELLACGDVERLVPAREGDAGNGAQQRARAFLFHVYRYSMFPVILVVYEREAYFGRFDPTVRLTFDKGLRARAYPPVGELFSEARLRSVFDENFILEVKFGRRMPSWIRSILEEFSLERRALSKFAMSLDAESLGGSMPSRTAWSAYLPPDRTRLR